MPNTKDQIDAAYEATGLNPLDDVARAAFRKGWVLAINQALRDVDAVRLGAYTHSADYKLACDHITRRINQGVRSACSGILSDLSK